MPEFSLVPVDYQPDFAGVSLVPVNHDPFGADRITQAQQAGAGPESQPEPGIRVAGAANDNRTPQEICDYAQAMCNATARMTAPAAGAQTMMKDCEYTYDLCATKAARGVFSRGGDIMEFPDGGKVIFRPEYQLYVPSPNRPPNFLKPD